MLYHFFTIPLFNFFKKKFKKSLELETLINAISWRWYNKLDSSIFNGLSKNIKNILKLIGTSHIFRNLTF